MKSARMQLYSVAVALGALLSTASATQIVYIDQLRAKAAALQGAPHPEVAAFGNMAQAFILQLEAAPAETAPPVHIPVPVSVPASTITMTMTMPGPAAVTVTVPGDCEGVRDSSTAPPRGPASQITGRVQETAVVTRTVMRITTVTCEEEEEAARGAATTMVTRTRGALEAAATEPCDE